MALPSISRGRSVSETRILSVRFTVVAGAASGCLICPRGFVGSSMLYSISGVGLFRAFHSMQFLLYTLLSFASLFIPGWNSTVYSWVFFTFHVENVCSGLFYFGVSLFRAFDTLHFLSLLCLSFVIYSSIVRLQHLHKICYFFKIQKRYMWWKVSFSLILTRNTSIYIGNMND